jgi:hypothetical protein
MGFPDAHAHETQAEVEYTQSSDTVEVYDFVEIYAQADQPLPGNPFVDVRFEGEFGPEGAERIQCEGFCDDHDGMRFVIRFMPNRPGLHRYTVRIRHSAGFFVEEDGSFTATESRRVGILRGDPDNPWHFRWSGTGEHYFWNGTTTYYLMAFRDDETIQQAIDRLADYGINRLRVLLYGREDDQPWGMPIENSPEFHMGLNPWLARYPEHIYAPEFVLDRFDVAFWRKYERMLAYARARDVVVSVVFFIGGQPCAVPFGAYSQDETRYYRYAVNRLAAFSNVTWDLGNEHDFHRDYPYWGLTMARLVRGADPYDHPVSLHNKTYDRDVDMQLIQQWDAGLHDVVLEQRTREEEAGRIVPVVIEEYGYEDLWEKVPGQRAADTRRRCAWEVCMAGGYQTTGESARNGGGWVNGRGDSTMTMLEGYRHLAAFFTSFPWWLTEPSDHAVSRYAPDPEANVPYYDSAGNRVRDLRAFCLSEPGATYVFYLPAGGTLTAKLARGRYTVRRFDPRNGGFVEAGSTDGGVWQSPELPDAGDWVFLLRAPEQGAD